MTKPTNEEGNNPNRHDKSDSDKIYGRIESEVPSLIQTTNKVNQDKQPDTNQNTGSKNNEEPKK